jgi:hypothetical protein
MIYLDKMLSYDNILSRTKSYGRHNDQVSPAASRSEVSEFLRRLKARMLAEGLHFVPRKRNLDGLALLGLTINEAERIILDLTEGNYCRGPEQDEDGSTGEIWFFGVLEDGRSIYIKVKLDDDFAKCLSFHPAERPMRHPYK